MTTVVEEGKNEKSGCLDEDGFFPKERGTMHAPTAKRSTNAATRIHGTTAQWRLKHDSIIMGARGGSAGLVLWFTCSVAEYNTYYSSTTRTTFYIM